MATQYTAGLTTGQVLTAATMNSIGAAWESYTPALTATTTNPTLGTGSSLGGAYARIQTMVVGWAYFAFGSSGTSNGSGDYRVSLPVTAKTSSNSGIIMGPVWMYDSSATAGFDGIGQLITSTTMGILKGVGTSPITINATNPFTWAANDQIRVFFIYEAA